MTYVTLVLILVGPQQKLQEKYIARAGLVVESEDLQDVRMTPVQTTQ